MVDDTDQSRLDDFAKEYKQMIDDRAKKIAEKVEALKNPKTLEDYRNLVRSQKWRMVVRVKRLFELNA